MISPCFKILLTIYAIILRNWEKLEISYYIDISIALQIVVGCILIFNSTIKCHKKDGDPLRCYKCGQDNFPSCAYFNGSEVFVTICLKDQKSCLKGWVNGSGGSRGDKKSEHEGKQTALATNFIRSCAPIAENICLKQNSGDSLIIICRSY